MRKALLIACALLLWGGMLSAQSINYYPAASSGTNSGTVLSTSGVSLGLATTGTAEEVLKTWTIPANTFPTANYGFRVYAWWNSANNANAKTPRIRLGGIGGTAICGAGIAVATERYYCDMTCLVAAAGVLECTGMAGKTSIGGGINPIQYSYTFTNSLDVVATGTSGVALGEITLNTFMGWFFRP